MKKLREAVHQVKRKQAGNETRKNDNNSKKVFLKLPYVEGTSKNISRLWQKALKDYNVEVHIQWIYTPRNYVKNVMYFLV